MKNRLFAILLLLGALLVSCDSRKSQLTDALQHILTIEKSLLHFYEQGGVDSLSTFFVEGKAMQIAKIEEFAEFEGLRISTEIDSSRTHNEPLLQRLYRAKAAEEYLVGVSYVELETAMEQNEIEGGEYSEQGILVAKDNLGLLIKMIESAQGN